MIVGLVGFIGSGKDTAGDMLHSQGFIRESFAKPLKDAVAIIFGWNRGMLEGANSVDRKWREQPDEYWSAKFDRPFTPRMALQLMGTEAGRNVFHQNIWLDSLEKRVRTRLESTPDANFVITDVRFNNEIKKLHDMGALIVRVKRGPEPAYYEAALTYNLYSRTSLLSDELKDIHISEWDWIGNPLIQHMLDNNGRLADLNQKISKLVDDHIQVEVNL